MTWMLAYPAISLCYFFLFLSVVLLWFPGKGKIPRWAQSLFVSVFFGLWSRQLEWSALISLLLFASAAYYSQAPRTSSGRRVAATSLVLFLSLALAIHQLPGFNSLQVLDHVYFTTDALSYSLYLNFDKTVIGLFILGLGPALLSRKKEILTLIRKTWPLTLKVILVVMILALIINFVRFEPKISGSIFIWALSNLLFTCVAEEALFRGFIQKKLTEQWAKVKGGSYLAWLAASLLFGLAHYAGGRKYVLLAIVAGLGYGWIYRKTQRIEAAILTHFSLNLSHFIFFTYPALASAI
jgi:membrane protease YdiL (CAAX protease family)